MSQMKEKQREMIINTAVKKGVRGIKTNEYIMKYLYGLGARDDSDGEGSEGEGSVFDPSEW